MPGIAQRRLGRRQADAVVSLMVERLAENGMLPPESGFDAYAFHRLRARVRDCFQVPQTSVTPVMARLLFALGAAVRPRRLLVVGSYCGNTLVWLAGWAVQEALDTGVRPDAFAAGCDVDSESCGVARANFARIGAGAQVRILARDGHAVLAQATRPWDLVLLDADDPIRRKAVYHSLLDAAMPRLRAGGVVLAHDTALAVFADDLRPYLDRVADRSRFAATVDLPVDSCGLSISLVGGETEF